MRHAWSAVLALGLAFAASPLAAQQGGSKEAQKFRSQIDGTRKSVVEARDQLKQVLAEFNGLVEGNAEKPDAAFKSLDGGVKKAEKSVAGVQKQVAGMEKEADKFFAAWDAQIRAFQNESLQKTARERLLEAKGTYDDMRENLTAAGQAYRPFIASLKDQISFLGTDLSPEALQALAPEVEKLNEMGAELFASVDKILNEQSEDEEQFDEAVEQEEDEATEAGDASPAGDGS